MHMHGAIDGPTCAERIRKRFPGVRVVILSEFTDEASIRMAFRRGAHAFISKAVHPRDIAPALRLAVSETVYYAPPDGGPLEAEDLAESLSEREATVLKAVAAGLSNQAIARRLWVSEHTVKFHLTNVFRKLDVSNRTEAARWAHRHGIVDDGVGEGAETDDYGAAGRPPTAGVARAAAAGKAAAVGKPAAGATTPPLMA